MFGAAFAPPLHVASILALSSAFLLRLLQLNEESLLAALDAADRREAVIEGRLMWLLMAEVRRSIWRWARRTSKYFFRTPRTWNESNTVQRDLGGIFFYVYVLSISEAPNK